MSDACHVCAGSVLSYRDVETLGLIGQGLSNGEIAHILGVVEKTVKNRVSIILSKLDVQSRTEAAIYAERHGLLLGPRDVNEDTAKKYSPAAWSWVIYQDVREIVSLVRDIALNQAEMSDRLDRIEAVITRLEAAA